MSLTAVPAEDTARTHAAAAVALVTNIERVVRGRRPAVDLVVCALLAGGHVLVEDLPGSGKTTLGRAVAASVGADFARIQATADLLPADITGTGVWNPGTSSFSFQPGPVFAQVVLVDELNRTSPRTQSAFLEALDEGAVTADGVRHPLPQPFFVLATQNPREQHGAYPLPEGQLDRFMVRLTLGDLALDEERRVVREQLAGPTVDRLEPVLSAAELTVLRAAARAVHVSDAVLDHAVALVRASRHDPRVRVGASSRAAIALVRCAQARALLRGRAHVLPDDTKSVAPAVLGHRLQLARGAGEQGPDVVVQLLERLPVPVSRPLAG